MAKYKVAHIREQGNDIIIVPVDAAFEKSSSATQLGMADALQRAALAAGLAGTVVPVWEHLDGRMAFMAPRNWVPYFQGISMDFVWANVNRELTL